MSDFKLAAGCRIGTQGSSPAIDYASWLLRKIGVEVLELGTGRLPADMPVLIAANPAQGSRDQDQYDSPLVVRLWDFHVGIGGSGVQACAVSGVSWVIGLPGRPPLYLPAQIPEKWCGTLAASMAMTWFVERLTLPTIKPPSRVFDVSAAEILRGFADQNFGNHKQIPTSWRRNGRVSPEHGGIYPQGFFSCKDGHVGVIGRSRQDWISILAALGDPEWSNQPGMRDPFALARDCSKVDPLFCAELEKHSRNELLERALAHGATFAPVYDKKELRAAHIVRDSYFDADGKAGMPFELIASAAGEKV